MLKKFLSPPVFADSEEKTRRASYINVIVLSNIPILLFFMIARVGTGAELFGIANLILLGIITVLVIVWILMRSGRVSAAGYLHVTTIWIASTMIALNGSGIRGTAFMSYFVVMLMAGLLLGWKPALGFIILSILAAFGLVGAENINITDNVPGSALGIAIEGTVLFIFGAIFLYLIINGFQSAVDRSNANAVALQTSNQQLLELRDDLEKRVADRTTELSQRGTELESANVQILRRASQFEALAQVTQAITAVRDLRELLPRIASVISERFGFYHVGIFLLDEISQYAILSAANSAGGKKMLERKHRLRVGEEGIVGYATATGKPRIALDVGKDAVYFTNLELPDTHSEMALPLIIKNIIVGALDVQSTEVAAFGNDDIRMLSLLADQVSLAIENARLFDDARKALAESEMISRSAVREAWARLPEEQKLLGYRYNITGAAPLHALIKLAEKVEVQETADRTEAGPAVVPIALRGEVIGNLIVQSASGDKWNDDQLDLIRAVAERVALSAENARLFEETTARAERERMVSEITGKIRSQNDPQSMIQTAIEELRSALGASRVEVIPQSAKSTGKSEA